jgi:alpha-D-xyloside xylohydrolase
MRIKDGLFNQYPGISFYPIHKLFEYKREQQGIQLYCIHEDGMYKEKLNGKSFIINVSSPFENVLRFKTRYHTGGAEQLGKFILDDESTSNLDIKEIEDTILLETGNLSAMIEKDPFTIEYEYDAKRVSLNPIDTFGVVKINSEKDFVTASFSISPDEYIYGLGERFGPFVRNGQHVEIWHQDAGTISDKGYKNVPFYLSSQGYGLFVNSTEKVEYELGTEEVDKIKITHPGHELDFYLISGGTLKDILRNYTALTGRPPIIPKWSLGLWLSTSFTTTYNREIVLEHISGMHDREIPLSVFHFDCFWMKQRHWCDFRWDEQAFPNPEKLLGQIKNMGIKICLWINPYISEFSDLFDEGKNKGYFLRDPNGDVYQVDCWQPGVALVDFTNQDACSWYISKLETLIEMGVDTFKTDFGEGVPEDAVFMNGLDGRSMHNLYPLLYNKTVFELLEKRNGKNNALVFARSATAGSQIYPVHWGGDSDATYASMAAQLRAGLSLSLSGFSFWSHDIGGFFSKPTPDLFKRWIAFGLLSSHSRLHGDSSYRVPWDYDEETVSVLKHFTELRNCLIPYIYSLAWNANKNGIPVMRPMILEFPDDSACSYLDRQYMLGPSLLVAPVLESSGHVSFYLPEGVWTDFWTEKQHSGGRWLTQKCDYYSLPLFVQNNAIIPMGPVEQAQSRDSFKDLELHLYTPKYNSSFEIFDHGKVVTVSVKIECNNLIVLLDEEIEDLKVILHIDDVVIKKSLMGRDQKFELS